MNILYIKLSILLVAMIQNPAYGVEIKGAGSKISESLIHEWAKVYTTRISKSVINYKGSNPAEGLKQLINREVDFCSVDMPLNNAELKKNKLVQFPVVLGGIAPVVNLPRVGPGQLKLDGKTLGDIFLGKIVRWNAEEIAALNPSLQLPDEEIIIIHRISPPGVRTVLGEYLAKSNENWKSQKGSTMAGNWPSSSILVKEPLENFNMIQKTPFSIGYGPVSVATHTGMAYVKMKNKAGYFVSPNDKSISSAALHSTWLENESFNADLTDQSGTSTWPLSMASFVLVRKFDNSSDRKKETLKFFRYSLRFGTLNALQGGYIQLPHVVKSTIRLSLDNAINKKGKA